MTPGKRAGTRGQPPAVMMDFQKKIGNHLDVFVAFNQGSGHLPGLILSVQALAETFGHIANLAKNTNFGRFHVHTLQY